MGGNRVCLLGTVFTNVMDVFSILHFDRNHESRRNQSIGHQELNGSEVMHLCGTKFNLSDGKGEAKRLRNKDTDRLRYKQDCLKTILGGIRGLSSFKYRPSMNAKD